MSQKTAVAVHAIVLETDKGPVEVAPNKLFSAPEALVDSLIKSHAARPKGEADKGEPIKAKDADGGDGSKTSDTGSGKTFGGKTSGGKAPGGKTAGGGSDDETGLT